MSKSKLEMFDCDFSKLSDDLVLKIFNKLEDDPRHWARITCVSTRFSSLIHNVCCKTKCCQIIPAVIFDLLSTTAASEPPGGWASMYKLAVCCPGLVLSGVLLEHLDFGLERELGPEEEFNVNVTQSGRPDSLASSSSNVESNVTTSDCCWSLYDDLIFDTMYDKSEAPIYVPDQTINNNFTNIVTQSITYDSMSDNDFSLQPDIDFSVSKKKKLCKSMKSHLASGVWNLSREEGNKLLASRFKGDCLYICDWPGCIHLEEKRNYMLFRGIFKNFKQSRVWRTINDGKRKMIELNCAFCAAKQTWDLHSAFCLRSHFGFHDDGEPVVRAYVCENGHVSGAWTDFHLYT